MVREMKLNCIDQLMSWNTSKKSYEELYNIYLEDVYGDETFKSDYGDDDFVKTLLMDVLSVFHFHKDESIYFDSDSEVNKYLHDLVMNETSLNRK